jgi:hypothetical protein
MKDLTFDDFPIYSPGYVSAMEDAKEISKRFSSRPIYVTRLNEGGYWIDVIYQAYSNQTLVTTLLNGEKSL